MRAVYDKQEDVFYTYLFDVAESRSLHEIR